MQSCKQTVAEWVEFSLSLTDEISEALITIANDKSSLLAEEFYRILLSDDDAARFLTSDMVQTQLRHSMAKWIIQALSLRGDALFEFANHQYSIGKVHSRIGIPANLVMKGMRVITRALLAYIQSAYPEQKISDIMQKYVFVAIQIASELMIYAYENHQVSETKTAESYRVHNLISSPDLEKGKQQASLFSWESSVIYALVSRTANIELYFLSNSEFALWFRHKCSPYFGHQVEIAEINTLIEGIDNLLLSNVGVEYGSLESIQSLLNDIRSATQSINNLLVSLFNDTVRLESGKDVLTDLLNRQFMSAIFKHEVKMAMEYKKNLSVVMLDVDNFKGINDNWGHSTGDDVLKHVANILSSSTRASDYLFRYGGEEFVIVYIEFTSQQIKRVVEALRHKLASTPLTLANGTTINVTASFGISHFRGHPDYQKMIDEADKALYCAKNNGKNCVVDFSSLSEQA